MRDEVDVIIEQWRRERPDLDLSAMATFGRLARLFAQLRAAVEETFTRHRLQGGEYDVLAALRRSGAPYTLNPSQLSDTLMLSRAGMTNRLDRLEAAGLISRRLDPDNRRSIPVTLTEAGRRLADEVTTEHVANEARLLAPLSPQQRHTLDAIAGTLLAQFEAGRAGQSL